MPVPNNIFDELVRAGRVTGLTQPAPPPRYEKGRELRDRASEEEWEEANRRHAIIISPRGWEPEEDGRCRATRYYCAINRARQLAPVQPSKLYAVGWCGW